MNEKLFLFQLQSLFGIVSKFISDHRKLSKDSKEIGRPLLSKGNLHFSLVEENQNDYDKKLRLLSSMSRSSESSAICITSIVFRSVDAPAIR